MSNQSWVQKYAPTRLIDVKGNPKALEIIKSWLDSYPNVREKALLLAGPPGTGKTSSVYAYARENGYDIIEFNASDTRNKDAVESSFYKALTEVSLVTLSKKKIVLLDEVDGMSGTYDRGGIAALLKVLEISAFPVIMTCNDLQNNRIASLRNKKSLIRIVQFKRLRPETIVDVLGGILNQENITYDSGLLRIIVAESSGDMRGAINDLENLGYGQARINGANLSALKNRDRPTDKYEGIQKIFESKTPLEAHEATRNMDLNFEFLIMWIYQNAYKWAGSSTELSEMYRYIALANIYRSRIYRTQYWKLLKYYFFFLSAGVNHAMKTPYRFKTLDWPVWGRFKQPPEEVRNDYARIAERNKLSMDKFYKEMLPYLKTIFRENTGKAYQLAESYLLSKESVAELAADRFDQYQENKSFLELWKTIKLKTAIQEKRQVKIKSQSRKSRKETGQEQPVTVESAGKIEKTAVRSVGAKTTSKEENIAVKQQSKKPRSKKTEKTVIKDDSEDKKDKEKKKSTKSQSASLSDFFKA